MDNINVRISLDGSQWCALVGENLQEGIAGFGDTPLDAFIALANSQEMRHLLVGLGI